MTELVQKRGKKHSAYWDFVERIAKEVATWPAWKRGEGPTKKRVKLAQKGKTR